MTIQFSPEEIATLTRYFDRVKAGEAQKQLQDFDQAFPEWNTVFLLLRKLLAYGVHHVVQTDPAINYPDLQKRSQKPNDMLVTVDAYFGQFDQLLTIYATHYPVVGAHESTTP